MTNLYLKSEWFRGVWFGSAISISGLLIGIIAMKAMNIV
jgi:hypothetical protein